MIATTLSERVIKVQEYNIIYFTVFSTDSMLVETNTTYILKHLFKHKGLSLYV